mmetsp:Transcript_52807/g.158069  ORF Transcript_52807/g.158069 Transcript_52807/m.158069 type:complete len:316 (-) Transcript_52807:241-1188(-)
MLPTPTERPRRLHVVISNSLQVPVHDRVTELMQDDVPRLLVHLLLVVCDGLLDDLLLVQVPSYRLKVALFEVLDELLIPFGKDLPKVNEEVLLEYRRRLGVAKVHPVGVHAGEKCGRLLLDGVQIDVLAVVLHLEPVRHVRLGKGYARVLHGGVLLARRGIRSVPPQEGLHGVLKPLSFLHLLELLGTLRRRLFLLRGRFSLDLRFGLGRRRLARPFLVGGAAVGRGLSGSWLLLRRRAGLLLLRRRLEVIVGHLSLLLGRIDGALLLLLGYAHGPSGRRCARRSGRGLLLGAAGELPDGHVLVGIAIVEFGLGR